MDFGSESEDDSKMHSKEEVYMPQRKGVWKSHNSIAIPALAVNKRSFIGDSIQRDLLDDSAISDDQNNSDHSDDDTSTSDCSTCTWSSNSTGASSTMDMGIPSRAWSLAQSVVDALAGTTDWRAQVVTRPANSNGGSSSKRNNSAVTGDSSDQVSRAGKRQCTAGNAKKAQPPNDRDQDYEDEDEEEDGATSINKEANDQPRLPCIFCIQSLRRPDLPPICKKRGLKDAHRLKEHIGRKHRIHQCLRCGTCFPDEDLLHDHIKAATGCLPAQPPPSFGVNLRIWTAIKSRKGTRSWSNEKKWKHMYQIIFPKESHVPSPYDSNIPLSDFVAEGARETSPPKEHFWQKLHKALYTNLERALREQDVPLKEIINESISQARTETSSQTSDSESKEGFPILLQNIADLRDVGPWSDLVGVDFEDTEVSGFDQPSKSITDDLRLGFDQEQTARHTRHILKDPTSAEVGVATNVASGQLSDFPTFMHTVPPVPDFNAMQVDPSSSSKEEGSELGKVPPITDPTYFTLFDSATSSAPENNFDFANEPFDAWSVGQQDFGPSDHLDGGDDAELNFWPDLPW